jgi:hypothetical protein
MKSLVLVLTVVLAGCASERDYWEANYCPDTVINMRKVANVASVKIVHIETEDVQNKCSWKYENEVFGCAIRIRAANSCIIFTRPNPSSCLMKHEELHCMGYDHGMEARTKGAMTVGSR